MGKKIPLDLLSYGRIKEWNKWRAEKPKVKIDLSSSNFRKCDLRGADLNNVNLARSNMVGVRLDGANLHQADLRWADLSEATFTYADLSGADLSGAYFGIAGVWAAADGDMEFPANLSHANLKGAVLSDTQFIHTDLSYADLSHAFLSDTLFSFANLTQADMSHARCEGTLFLAVNLSTVKGLGEILHYSLSHLDIYTLILSKGNLPEVFLRGCGVPDNIIPFLSSFGQQGIEFYSCFISYSHVDREFAYHLHDRLQQEGIRCWLDEHQLNPGDILHSTIYEAIRVYDKLLLCCSNTALKSWWVEKEFSRAIRKEEDYKDTVLVLPLNLDNYLFTPECTGWLADEVKQRLVADFTEWRDEIKFEKVVKKVIKALRTDGGNLPTPQSKLVR